jgi:hypothetical protein
MRVWGTVAEMDALVASRTLVDIVETSRQAVATRLHLARLEVEMNVWRCLTRELRT